MLKNIDKPQIPDNLKKWVAYNILKGNNLDSLSKRLWQQVGDNIDAVEEIRKIQSDAITKAAQELIKNYRKVQNLVDLLGVQIRSSVIANGIPKIEDVSPEAFFKEYYFCNRPVVVKGLMSNWRAKEIWSFDLFKKRYGDIIVEVNANRNTDSVYEQKFDNHRQFMAMSDFINKVSADAGNDIYIVARNKLLERPEFSDLLEEFHYPEGFLDPLKKKDPHLRIGGAATITPLHHDAANIFFGQVSGRKLVKLIHPFEAKNLYNTHSCYSAVDVFNIDFDTFPLMRDVLILEVLLEPGDFLLLPLGWWHAVKSLDPSISLNFQNFSIPGQKATWKHHW